jgi:hypothetical protein
MRSVTKELKTDLLLTYLIKTQDKHSNFCVVGYLIIDFTSILLFMDEVDHLLIFLD